MIQNRLLRSLRKHPLTAATVTVIFFTVGVTGMLINETRPLFSSLFPLALLLSIALLIVYSDPFPSTREVLIYLGIAVAGFAVEVAGVKTGIIFGNYRYGDALGFSIAGVPVMIGINWILVSLAAGSVSTRITENTGARIILSALIMTTYDIVLEQAAGILGMWHWEGGSIPARNYFAWLIISLVFSTVLHFTGSVNRSRTDRVILLSHTGFFIILILFLDR